MTASSPVPVVTAVHPPGAAGAKVSLEKMSERIRQDYLDPLVVAWARRAVAAAGGPRGATAKAQAILDAMKGQTKYVLDPTNSEYIASARLVLCLDSSQKDLCHVGGDCEELAATLCSALMAVGVDCLVVGQAFTRESTVPTHVIMSFYDSATGKWLKIDPCTSMPIGQSYPATSEVEVDPLTGKVPDFDGPNPPAAYVGVGGTEPSRLRRRGVGATQAQQAAAQGLNVLQQAVLAVTESYFDLNAAYANLVGTRSRLGIPTYDPSNPSITSIPTLPTPPVFTTEVEQIVKGMLQTLLQLSIIGNEALAGSRQVLFDPRVQEFFVSAKSTDAFKAIQLLNPVTAGQTIGKAIVGFFSSSGQALQSIDASGNVVPATTVAAAFAASPISQVPTAAQQQSVAQNASAPIPVSPVGVAGLPRTAGVGNPVVIVALVVLGVVVVSIAAYFAIKALADALRSYMQETTNQDLAKCVASGKCPESIVTAITNARNVDAQAEAQKAGADPYSKPIQAATSLVGALTFAAIAVGGFILAKELIDRQPHAATTTRAA